MTLLHYLVVDLSLLTVHVSGCCCCFFLTLMFNKVCTYIYAAGALCTVLVLVPEMHQLVKFIKK